MFSYLHGEEITVINDWVEVNWILRQPRPDGEFQITHLIQFNNNNSRMFWLKDHGHYWNLDDVIFQYCYCNKQVCKYICFTLDTTNLLRTLM